LASTVTIVIPASIAERLRREADRLGSSLEEYIVELALQGLDPPERAGGYAKASKELLEHAEKELERGNTRQAAEKAWGAAALAVKAYAEWREGRSLSSHGELWEYRRRLEEELGDWVYDSWMSAAGMHTCFYEGWCNAHDVSKSLERIKRLVDEVIKLVKS